MTYDPTPDIQYIQCPSCHSKSGKPCERVCECGCGVIELDPHPKRIKEAIKAKREDLDYHLEEVKRMQSEIALLEGMIGKKAKVK